MLGLRSLFVLMSDCFHDWLLRNVTTPTAPVVPKLILRKRRFNTGRWY
jgi:hypothetical protein